MNLARMEFFFISSPEKFEHFFVKTLKDANSPCYSEGGLPVNASSMESAFDRFILSVIIVGGILVGHLLVQSFWPALLK